MCPRKCAAKHEKNVKGSRDKVPELAVSLRDRKRNRNFVDSLNFMSLNTYIYMTTVNKNSQG